MARALANVIGNGVATIVVAKLENEFHPERTAETAPAVI
jgi:aerobic C4-dicarboxylate transport protein